jgi:nucleoid-associated protein YejK
VELVCQRSNVPAGVTVALAAISCRSSLDEVACRAASFTDFATDAKAKLQLEIMAARETHKAVRRRAGAKRGEQHFMSAMILKESDLTIKQISKITAGETGFYNILQARDVGGRASPRG